MGPARVSRDSRLVQVFSLDNLSDMVGVVDIGGNKVTIHMSLTDTTKLVGLSSQSTIAIPPKAIIVQFYTDVFLLEFLEAEDGFYIHTYTEISEIRGWF